MDDALQIAMRAGLVVLAIILLTRMFGLRSFSKMSGFDFAITVAMGSVLAGAVTTLGTSVWVYCGALLALFAVQALIARARTSSETVENASDNCPILIMEHGEILEKNLAQAKMTKGDLYGKLREANAIDLSLVRAVVFETTGDVSVLHKQSSDDDFSDILLEGVQR